MFLPRGAPDPEAIIYLQEEIEIEVDPEDANDYEEEIEHENIEISVDVGSVKRNLFHNPDDMKAAEESEDVAMSCDDNDENDGLQLANPGGINETVDDTTAPSVVMELSESSVPKGGNLFVDPNETVTTSDGRSKKISVSVMDEPIYDLEDIGDRKDSDYEDGDNSLETQQRMIRKTKRHLKRNQLQNAAVKKLFPDDQVLADEFQDYMIKRTMSESSTKSTVTKATGHIITYPDSLIQYEYLQDDKFRLVQNVDFASKDYRDVVFPVPWIIETCSNDPNRAVEKLKSHSYWRDFVKLKVSNSSISTKRKNEVNKVIDTISEDIQDQKVYKRYNTLVNNETNEKRQAQLILNPEEASNVAHAVLKWNQSKEKQELDLRMTKYYNDAKMKGKDQLRNREFTQFSHFVRFCFILSDKNRITAYKFRNLDLASRSKVWFPDGCGLDSLPPGYNPHTEPSPNKPPSAWVMQVPGM